jgi:Polysulphide reductase, NrfD
LKAPTWTWQVPLYLFAGGVAGTSAVIAVVARIAGHPGLLRSALWIAFAGVLASPPLLIADLGKPNRFLNMLRVFKLRSVMSVGAWTLAAFSCAIGLAVVCRELLLAGYGYSPLLLLEWLAEIFAAFTGLILASYTSVLLGVTAIPVWSENRRLIPAVFLAGGVGSASAVLELMGFIVPATQFIGILASVVETVVAVAIELRGRYVDRPLREGPVGWLVRAGGTLAGPVPLFLRFFAGHNPAARYLAASCFIAGALVSRYAWIAAGRPSSYDPQALFQMQRSQRRATPTK